MGEERVLFLVPSARVLGSNVGDNTNIGGGKGIGFMPLANGLGSNVGDNTNIGGR